MNPLVSLVYLLRLDAETYDTTLPPAIVRRMRNAADVVEQFDGLQAQLQAKEREVESLTRAVDELQRENERLSRLVPPIRAI